jgi:DHA3 family macrolide efflux protein-like MFS transporter
MTMEPASSGLGSPGQSSTEAHGPGSRTFRTFLILWSGQALSLIGSQAVQFALIWWLTLETGSATVLATAAFVGLFPQIALGPVIGALVDRWNRKKVMLAADGAVALASLGLAFLFFAGQARLEYVFVALAIRAVGSAFHCPSMIASTSLMVPDRHLTRIQGLNQSLQGGLNIVSAPLGALLIAVLPMGGILLVDVVTALFAIIPLLFIRVPQPARVAAHCGKGLLAVWQDVAGGFRYLRARPGHLSLMGMAAVVNLCTVPAFSLLPLLVSEELGGDAGRLGWMNSTLGVGMLAGGIGLGIWGGFRRRIVTTLVGLQAVGLAILALGLAPASPVALAFIAMLAIGLTIPLVNGPILAIMQATIPAGLQGRVFTLLASLSGAMAPIGLFLAAPVAGLLGVRIWYVIAGLACLLVGVAAFLVPAILRIEESSHPMDNDLDLASEPAA